jgi:competence protein ComEC
VKRPLSEARRSEARGEWRFAALAGITAGLAAAPAAPARPTATVAAALPITVIALAASRPRDRAEPALAITWLAVVALVSAFAGFLAGGARVHAIDAGALVDRAGARVSLTGFVSGVPRRMGDEIGVRIDSRAGRVLVAVSAPLPELPVGGEIRAEGVLAEPEPWRVAHLRRQGIAMVLRSDRVEPSPGRRRGPAGWIDQVRARAEQALDRGMPDREASLARGFVLGEDDRIDPRMREEFQRSNLAHLLAVSGQNVLLLCLLAWPLFALLGLTLRARLIASLCLIAIYVPVTGAGPSIQRAGVMGAAGLVGALADRPRSRWYALLFAAATTLAINPRAHGDVGWQLSFAAVIGILLWSARLASILGGGVPGGSARRALIEGVAVTVAATVATAPLMAHHFEQFSPVALPANVLALPAVAPAMWLGMLSGIVGQAPVIPVEPLNWLNSLCLAYIAQVAHWLASPDWALVTVQLPSIWSVVAAYAALLGGVELLIRWLHRRRGLALARRDSRSAPKRHPKMLLPSEARLSLRGRVGWPAVVNLAGPAAILLVIAVLLLWSPFSSRSELRPAGFVVRVLDVGQGDSILLQPADAEPVLVDTGPPGADVEERLRELGVDSLAAVVVTHDQSDHAGGVGGVLESVEVGRVVYGVEDPDIRGIALGAGAEPFRLAEGGELASGDLRLTALWPPREIAQGHRDPNQLSLVAVARWRHFSMLLMGDAEAESVPVDPGPVDILKVGHHGSADEGLDRLLEHATPRVAVISVGEDNGFGHPAPETLRDLRTGQVSTLRTDQSGEIAIEADVSGWTTRAGEG